MQQVIDLLKKSETMAIATSWNEKPRVSVVDIYVLSNDAVVFMTDPKSIKAQNLEHNNRISASVVQMPLFVTIDGKAVTPSKEEIDEFNRAFFTKHPEFAEMMKQEMAPPAYYKIMIETAYYNDFTNGMSDTQIIHA